MTKRKWIALPVIILAFAVLAVAIKSRLSRAPIESQPFLPLVEVSELKQQPISPVVHGYGVVLPAESWKGIAEVSGKVIEKNPRLKSGFEISQDEVLLRLDDTDYQIKLAQARANSAQAQISLDKLSQNRRNLQRSLNVEKEKLVLLEKDMQRKQQLKAKGLTADADIDSQKRTLLAQDAVIQNIENELELLPSEIEVAKAKLDAALAQEQDAKRDIEKTVLRASTDLYIEDVDVSLQQWVNAGTTLASGYVPGSLELHANFSPLDVQRLLLASNVGSEALNSGQFLTGLTGSAEWKDGENNFQWPAVVTQIGNVIDDKTANILVVMAFSHSDKTPYQPQKGMLAEAVIQGESRSQYIVPQKALHGESIYLIHSGDNHVYQQRVKTLFRKDGFAAISGEFASGDHIVLNDLLPFIDGMQVRIQRQGVKE